MLGKTKLWLNLALLAAVTSVLLLAPRTGEAAPCTTTLSAGDAIQTAIDAASSGAVICLDPGTYSPGAKIDIDKSITLQGPQSGVDPRPSSGTSRTPGDSTTEAVIDGTSGGLGGIIEISADDVVLDGLNVKSGSSDLIASDSNSDISGIVIKYTIIHAATGDEGIQLRDCTNCVIAFNHVFDIRQDGINMCCGSTGGAIQFNEVHDNTSENAAIYIYDSTDMLIKGNLVYDVTGNDGIKLGTKGGDNQSNAGGSIVDNVVYDTAQDGITVYMSDTLVSRNYVSSSSSENGAIYVAFAVENVDITYNCVYDNVLDTGKWGDPAGVLIGTGVLSATVNHNFFQGNSPNGVSNKAAGIASLNAEDNWWGAADGPSVAGPGSGDGVSTGVDFDPFLDTPHRCGPGENIDSSLTLNDLDQSYSSNTVGGACPGGVHTLSAEFENTADPEVSFLALSFYVATLTNGATLLNSDVPFGGVGSTLSVAPGDVGDGDGTLNFGETLTQTFEVCLAKRAKYTFLVNAFGVDP